MRKKLLGLILFKEEGESTKVIRIVKVKEGETPKTDKITIRDMSNDDIRFMSRKELSEYTPLEPHAILTASIISTHTSDTEVFKDVIVTVSNYYEARAQMLPYAICRQGAIDIFNNFFNTGSEDNLYGLSVNRDTCPHGFNMTELLAGDDIEYFEMLNFYRFDTIDNILSMLPKLKFNNVLTNNYNEFVKHQNNPMANMKNYYKGYCKTIDKLLVSNDFQADIDQMFGILYVDFNMSDFLEDRPLPDHEDITYKVANQELLLWMSSFYNVNMKEANVIDFDIDIDVADYKNTNYVLLRDNTNTLYIVVYTKAGEFLESDLEAKSKELDFSSKFRLKFYNKYKDINDNNTQS